MIRDARKKIIAASLAVSLVAGFGVSSLPAGGFLDAVEDIPLMEGLAETGEGGIVFDKPGGRIVRAIAEGGVATQAVRRFYIETLPQLGWRRADQLELFSDLLVFVRDGERLEIAVLTAPGTGSTQVRFSIEPD